MTSGVDVIIKLGGSAITDKNKFETLKEDAIEEAVNLLKACVQRSLKCIVVHGAGSFGHHHARQYNLNAGFIGQLTESQMEERKLGLCKTRQSVQKLQKMLVEKFIDHDILAVAFSVFGSWRTENGVIVRDNHDLDKIRPLTDIVRNGFVPVVHGDCVLDTIRGCGILSGDTIIKEISSFACPDRVVFLTDTRGVYDRPPNIEGAELVREILVDIDGELNIPVSTSHPKHDVTGGIQLKLETSARIVCAGAGRTRVYVCRIGSKVAIQMCVHEEHSLFTDFDEGTVIAFSGK